MLQCVKKEGLQLRLPITGGFVNNFVPEGNGFGYDKAPK
jgi:hypothetical protein